MKLDRLGGIVGAVPAIEPRTGAHLRSRDFGTSLDALLSDPAAASPEATAPESASGLRFSKHAAARMESRGLTLDAAETAELEEAVEQLAARGAKESLVLLGDRAFVVGVPKRTVITAMPRDEALGTVFTNIDSTYVA